MIELRKGQQNSDLIKDHSIMMTYCFGHHPIFPHKTLTKEDQEKLKEIHIYYKYTYHYLLYLDHKPMSGGDISIYSTNLRGNIFHNGGVGDIVTIPEGRRKGFTKKIFKEMFNDMKEKEIPISTLYPFKGSFYEKFGYVSCGSSTKDTFPIKNIEYLTNFESKNYYYERTQLSDLEKSFPEEFMKLLQEIQKKVHGYTIPINMNFIDLYFEKDSYCLVVRKKNDKSLAGFMKYSLEEPVFVIDRYIQILNEEVKFLIFHFVSLNSDHSEFVKLEIPPNVTPGNYLPDITSQMVSKGRSIQMGRIMIVEKLNGIKLKCQDLSIILSIQDEYCDWNHKTFLFKTKDEILHVEAQKDTSDVKLDIRGLSSFVFGAVHDVSLIEARGWGNLKDKELEILDSMFPYQIPMFNEEF